MTGFSEIVMDHFLSPRNQGQLDAPTYVGVAGTPGQGPFVVIQLEIAKGIVQAAKFQSHTCGATIASVSLLTEMICGQPIDYCRNLTGQDLIEALDGLPPHKRHCADFAVRALSNALTDLSS